MEVLHLFQHFVGIYTNSRIAFFCYVIRFLYKFFFHDVVNIKVFCIPYSLLEVFTIASEVFLVCGSPLVSVRREEFRQLDG